MDRRPPYNETHPSHTSYPVFHTYFPLNDTLKVRFLGGVPGSYSLTLKFKSNVDGTETVFPELYDEGGLDVNAYIYEIEPSPLKCSTLGGCVITIKGIAFSENGLENNVKVGDTDCLVLSSSNQTIVCELDPNLNYDSQEE